MGSDDPIRPSCPASAGGLALLLLAACASFTPKPLDSVPFRERAVTREDGDLTVTVAVPSPEEARAIFGVDLESRNVQPVWIEIDNQSDQSVFLFELLVDPAYYSAYEVAYMSHRMFAGARNDRVDEHFGELAIGELRFDVGEKRSGFVFTNPAHGIKYTELVFLALPTLRAFPFSVPLAEYGGRTRGEQIAANYGADEWRDFDDGLELLAELERLPAATAGPDGDGRGEPLNIVLIGAPLDLELSLLQRGWIRVPVVGERTAKLDPEDRRFWPVEEHHAFGRIQDFAARRVRSPHHQPLHLYGWITPLRFRGMNVFVASISRDAHAFASLDWNPARRVLDPDVDRARGFLSQDLVIAGRTELYGLCGGVGAAPPDAPHTTVSGETYWTDGNRAICVMSGGTVALGEVRFFDTTGDFLIGEQVRPEAVE